MVTEVIFDLMVYSIFLHLEQLLSHDGRFIPFPMLRVEIWFRMSLWQNFLKNLLLLSKKKMFSYIVNCQIYVFENNNEFKNIYQKVTSVDLWIALMEKVPI